MGHCRKKYDKTGGHTGQAKELNVNLSKVSRIKADASDAHSLLRMARRTTVIVNAVGPFEVYGRQAVEASLQAGTHHIDVRFLVVQIFSTFT